MIRTTQHMNIASATSPPGDPRFLMLAFGPGEVGLTDAGSVDLRRWVDAWMTQEPTREVIVGFEDDAVSAGRMRRLEAVGHALKLSGVPARQVRFANGRAQPSPPAETADLPADVVVLRTIGAANANSQIRPLESIVAPSTTIGGSPCTSAS